MMKQLVTNLTRTWYLSELDGLTPEEAGAFFLEEAANIRGNCPTATDIVIVADHYGDTVECYLKYSRLETDDEEQMRELKEQKLREKQEQEKKEQLLRLVEHERAEYLRLKKKFERQ